MRHPLRTLRGRLILSHLAVVAVGVVLLLLAGRRLGDVFVHEHLRSMEEMMGMMGADAALLEEGIRNAFDRALLWAAALSAVVATTAATLSAARLLRPLEEVRKVARRLSTGSYHERVPVPAEEELAALAEDVNALAESLEETEQRRLRLVSEVAHELRTPVATLRGYLEGLLDGVFDPDPETLAAAIRETNRMERLATDLNALSRAEEGRVDLKRDVFDLMGLTAEIADRLRPQTDEKGVALTIEPEPAMQITADRDRIAQVLTNIIGNALTYTPADGHIRIRVRRSGHTASVEVTDTGVGLTPDQTSHVFERFYRADRSQLGGTGIGLTIARSLARLHGGEVSATSPGPGKGSTFTLTLPTD